MRMNERGLKLLKEFEGLSLRAYPDPATGGDPWTIGHGHTGPDVYPGLVITSAGAEELLRRDLDRFVEGVADLIGDAPTTSNQFSAMVSLAYNIGLANFAKSTVLKRHKLGNPVGAAKAFALWNRAAGKVMRGLTRRREAEAELYESKA